MPMVLSAVSWRTLKERSVCDALVGRHWISDISTALSMQGIIEFIHLADIVEAQDHSTHWQSYGPAQPIANTLCY